MKLVNFDIDNGRPISNDDLRILQEEFYKAIQLIYAGQGAFILQGVTVSGLNVSSGLVYINGLILEFDATTVSSFPVFIVQNADVDIDTDLTELGDSFAKRTIQKAGFVTSAPGSGEYIILNSTGGRNSNDILATQFVRLFGNQNISGTKNFASPVISNGVNVNDALNTINSAGWVTTPRIADFNVTHGKIAGNSIDSVRLQDGSVTSSKIVDGNVVTSKIADANVTNAKLADGSVTTGKIVDGNVTTAKLDPSVLGLFTGNGASQDVSVNMSTQVVAHDRGYTAKLFSNTNNVGKLRPFISAFIMAARDSGSNEFPTLYLQRSTSSGGPWTTICQRTFQLSDSSWVSLPIQHVDTGVSTAGNYWYRLYIEDDGGSGNLLYLSQNMSMTIFSVPVY